MRSGDFLVLDAEGMVLPNDELHMLFKGATIANFKQLSDQKDLRNDDDWKFPESQ